MFFKRIVLFLSLYFYLSRCLFAAEGMPQFNADSFPSQLFWLLITFLILYLILYFIILPRIRDNLRLRRNKISNDIERAELIKTQIENITVEYEEKIEKAKARANETIKNAYEKASLEFSSQLSGAKKRISQKINEAETEIIEYKKSIAVEVISMSQEISSMLLKKVLGKSLDKEDINFIKKQVSTIKVE